MPHTETMQMAPLLEFIIYSYYFVEKLQFSLFLISCCPEILNSLWLSWFLLLKIVVYMYLSQLMRTFTNYLKCIVFSFGFPLSNHQKYQKTEIQQSNISTYTLISSSINTYVIDLFLVILFTY